MTFSNITHTKKKGERENPFTAILANFTLN